MIGNLGGQPPIPSLSDVQSLKSLVQLISDQKNLDKVLKELDSKLTELHDAIGDLNEKQASGGKVLGEIESQRKSLDADLLKYAEERQALHASSKAVGARESNLVKGERDLEVKTSEFELKQRQGLEELELKSKEAANKQAEAQKLAEEAKALIQQYNQKTAKLKSALGE